MMSGEIEARSTPGSGSRFRFVLPLRRATSLATRVLGAMGRRRGRFSALPFSGSWTATRDLPAPQGESFQSQWARRS